MAIRGPKPQTDQQKRAKGETRPSRMADTNVVEFPVVSDIPDPPEWLNEDGVLLWQEIAAPLTAQRVLTSADVHALAHLCQMHGEIIDGYRRRLTPTAAQLSQLRMYFAEFGMTPSSRTRVGAAGGKSKENGFAKNGAKARKA